MKHDCDTCKYGNELCSNHDYDECVKLIESGQADNCPNWVSMTNGDRVRHMSDEELMELWGMEIFDDTYFPSCATDPDTIINGGCQWMNFSCECCPRTFFNWLKADVEDE